jgi:hypothetical protein
MVEMVQPSEGSHFMVCALKWVSGSQDANGYEKWGSSVSSRAKMEVGTEKTGRWRSKRTKGMGDGGVPD